MDVFILESQDIRAEKDLGHLGCPVPHFTYDEIEARGGDRDLSPDLNR